MEVFVSVPFIKSLKLNVVTLSPAATVCELLDTLTETHGLPRLDFYVKNNGRLSSFDDIIQHGGVYHLEARLPGGKGGFGSMLRALGAQIEKTTNREACRDLSGRRLRDVNHEKEMAEWLQKQGEREAEKEQRRLDRIQRKLSEPKHHFTDPQFHQQCHDLSERLDDSVLKGMQASSSALVSVGEGQEGRRGKRINKSRQEDQQHAKKTCMWTGVDDLDSSEEDDDDEGLPSISPMRLAAQRSVEPQLSNRAQSSSTGSSDSEECAAMETEPQSSAASSSSDPPPSAAEPQPGPSSVQCDPSGSQCDPSAPEASSPQHREQKQKVLPVEPEVLASAPVDPEVLASAPVDPEVLASAPVDPEVVTSAPVDPKVVTSAPVDPEVLASAPVDPEVLASAPVDPEVVASAPVDPEVLASAPVDPEVLASAPVDPEVVTSAPVDPEVVASAPVESKAVSSGPVDLEAATSAQELEVFGLEALKAELMSRGLKCGGTLGERATRLFSVKGLKADQINPLLMAKATKGKKK